MGRKRGLLYILILAGLAGSCFDPPQFPIQPRISFESIDFVEYGSGFDSEPDSLILKVAFQDGDGDLGLDPSELGCISDDVCFNNKFYFIKGDGTPVTYKDKRTNPDFSDLPDFVKPYSCINWEVRTLTSGGPVDTLYFELNPDHYNMEVDFLVKNPVNGSFEEFDWSTAFDYPFCGGTFDGRFPILFKDRPGSPLEGVIRYGMGSTGFKVLFSTKTLKLRVKIKDRALHVSNEIETREFTFQ